MEHSRQTHSTPVGEVSDLDKKLDQIVDDFIKSLNAKPIPPFNEADYEDVDYSRRFVGQVELIDTTNLEQT